MKDARSRRCEFGVALPHLVSPAQAPWLHANSRIDPIQIRAAGTGCVDVLSDRISLARPLPRRVFAIAWSVRSKLIVELCATRGGIFAGRRAGAVRVYRQSRAPAIARGLFSKACWRHPGADQRDRQKMENDPQTALLGIICLTRRPAPRRVRPGPSHDHP